MCETDKYKDGIQVRKGSTEEAARTFFISFDRILNFLPFYIFLAFDTREDKTTIDYFTLLFSQINFASLLSGYQSFP